MARCQALWDAIRPGFLGGLLISAGLLLSACSANNPSTPLSQAPPVGSLAEPAQPVEDLA